MIRSIESTTDIQKLYHQMQDLYGVQSHINEDLLLKLATHYPQLFLIGLNEKMEISSHLIALPLNSRGRLRMTDDSTFEADLTEEDFLLAPSERECLYIFIYSIYGKSDFQSVKMIKSLYRAIEALEHSCHKDSLLFAECVSDQGRRISERMGLFRYHTYIFEGEELFLYHSTLNKFLTFNNSRSSLSAY